MRRNIVKYLMILLPCLPSFAFVAWSSDSASALKLPFALRWDVAPKDSSITQDFIVKKDRTYQFEITFKCVAASISCSFENLKKFVGEGAHHRLTKESADTDHPVVVPGNTRDELEFLKSGGSLVGGTYYKNHPLEKNQRFYAPPSGTVVRMLPDGVIIPIHIRIDQIDSTGVATLHTDKVQETTGFRASGQHGLVRAIAYVRLKPGKYRASANTTRETAVPQDVEIMFVATWDPR
jgi:hypothetical protein